MSSESPSPTMSKSARTTASTLSTTAKIIAMILAGPRKFMGHGIPASQAFDILGSFGLGTS